MNENGKVTRKENLKGGGQDEFKRKMKEKWNEKEKVRKRGMKT